MHFVRIIRLVKFRNRLNIQDVKSAASTGISDKRIVLVIFIPPKLIAAAVVARCPRGNHNG